MEKRLVGLSWKCSWVSQLGCLKGCLEYLGDISSMAWLFGITGYAFIINMHETVCPSSPTTWDGTPMSKLIENIGYVDEAIFGLLNQPDFYEKQVLSWEKIRRAIDEGFPCYGWELEIPEFYVINGYSENEYFFSGIEPSSLNNRRQWDEVGKTEIGVLEMHIIKPTNLVADIRKIVKDSLGFILKHSKSPPEWIFPKYKAGIEGFDYWINAIKENKANKFGMAYNTAVWNECRQYGVEFLRELKDKIDAKSSKLIDEAITNYETVSSNLKSLAQLFPFPPKDELDDLNLRDEAIKILESAKKAESNGLKSLEETLNSIN